MAVALIALGLLGALEGGAAAGDQRQAPRRQEACAPVVQVEQPAPGAVVRGPVTISGWAIDSIATADTGVTTIQVYAGAPRDAGGTPVGTARYGLPRPDVAAAYGDNFAASAFELRWDPGALAGPQTLYVYAETACGWQSAEVAVTLAPAPPVLAVTPVPTRAPEPTEVPAPEPTPGATAAAVNDGRCAPELMIEFPPPGSKVPSPGEFMLVGWAIDPKAREHTGVNTMRVLLGPGLEGPTVGVMRQGLARIDVAETFRVTTTMRFYTAGWAAYLDSRQLTPDSGSGTTGKTTLTVVGETACGPISKTITVELALPSDETKAATALQPPRNLRLNQYKNGLVILAWDPSPSQKVTNYVVQMSQGGAGFRNKKTVSAAEVVAEIGGLDFTNSYAFQVYAVRNDETSPPTNIVSGSSPISAIGPLPIPPANPGVTRPENDLTPTAGPGVASGPGARPGGPSGSSGPPPNFFGLPGTSSSSAAATASVGSNPAPPASDATPVPQPTATPAQPTPAPAGPTATPTPANALQAPLLLMGQPAGPGQRAVTLTFNAVPGAQSYQLMRASTPNGPFTQVATANAGVTSISDPGVPQAGTYYYQLIALGPNNARSPASNTVVVRVT